MLVASLPDLDSLDLEATKALLIAQHEKYTATLSSRASEIERLALLVEKLQRMLFGKRVVWAVVMGGCQSYVST